jgi:Copper type II ascorbate-dependent monooxygenase, C-terminal domain
MRRATLHGALSAALALAACAEPAPETGDARGELTYWGDVYPILAARCLRCHLNGPSSYRPWFDGYDSVAQVAGAIASSARGREMPPWAVTADGTCGDWDRAHWLSEEEIETLERWADSDLLEGDEAEAGATALEPAPRELTRVDAVLDTGVDYQPVLPDGLHRCFRAELDLAAASHVTAFRVRPGNPAAVQHVSIYALDSDAAEQQVAALETEDSEPGYRCFSGSRAQDSRLLATWTWGDAVFRYPDDTGVRVEPGRDVIVQVHYNTNGGSATPDPDRTRIELELDARAREGRFVPLEVTDLVLPPGQQVATAGALLTVPDSVLVHGVFPFMHSLGHTLRLLDSTTACLTEVTHWHLYSHMSYYGYREPVAMSSGDRLWLECSYDTRSRTEATVSGEAFDREACRVNAYVTEPGD